MEAHLYHVIIEIVCLLLFFGRRSGKWCDNSGCYNNDNDAMIAYMIGILDCPLNVHQQQLRIPLTLSLSLYSNSNLSFEKNLYHSRCKEKKSNFHVHLIIIINKNAIEIFKTFNSWIHESCMKFFIQRDASIAFIVFQHFSFRYLSYFVFHNEILPIWCFSYHFSQKQWQIDYEWCGN